MGGRLPSESVAGLRRNHWPLCVGLRTLNAEYAKIWPQITVKRVPPPDFKEWEGKPDKFQYFSPNPGAGG